MSTSHNRWYVYRLEDLLKYHGLPSPEPDPETLNKDSLLEALLWLRANAPTSTSYAELEAILRVLPHLSARLERIHEQLTCVARAIEGDDLVEDAVATIAQLDEEIYGGDYDPWIDAPPTPEELEALKKAGSSESVPWE